ncbi:DUF4192 family protein [Homoserinimonas sp. OAct 916]|uniref:DUF4192 family protein n=1 Tax=Homoserinimonas sp. OAct 916 TaxID=2211450 RepID=UPI000DBE4BAE|nr:DUF4192 family protein [Homoserinimonas sp. OAct 916]
MKTIVKTREAHEFLALVPHLVGFTPKQSVVMVVFRGNQTSGALRVDLPVGLKEQFQKKFVTTLVGMLCKVRDADAVVPVIYTDESFAHAGGAPHLELATMLVGRAEMAGFAVRDALCVAADGWGGYLDPHAPSAGRPLTQIIESERSTPWSDRADHRLGPAAEMARIPTADPAVRRRVAADLGHLTAILGDPRSNLGLVRMNRIVSPVDLAEISLSLALAGTSTRDTAILLHFVQAPPNRDQMMMQFAFGPEVGHAVHTSNKKYLRIQAQDGRSMDEIVAEEIAARQAAGLSPMPEKTAYDPRTGATLVIDDIVIGHVAERPDVDRVRRGIALLTHLVQMAPKPLRPAPLCMLAWLNWTLGLGSVAGLHLDRALKIDPQYGMAVLLNTMLASGHLPEWAFNDPGDAPRDRGSALTGPEG